jgi:putative CocE/NonD family hydrolase
MRSSALLSCAVFAATVSAQGVDYIRSHYTKYEYQIAMRDGVRLFTAVYVPKDTTQSYPILLERTPYTVAPYGIDNYPERIGPSEKFAREGYIVVYQDVRGAWMSEGEFVNMRPILKVHNGPKDIDESTDTYDTVDWLVKNVAPNNGRVGIWGISYPGFYTSTGIIDAHPAVKAASPQAPITDWFIGDDFHHNGAFYMPHAFRFFEVFGKPRPAPVKPPPGSRSRDVSQLPDAYSFFLEAGTLANLNEKYLKYEVPFWNEMMQHGSYDEYWQARDLRRHLNEIKPAVMTVGGWFDAEDLFGALQTYKTIEKTSPGTYNTLVMGPWCHGCWSRTDGEALGNVKFGAKTGVFYRDEIEFPFFQHFLKEKPDPKLPEAFVFETGTNQWRREPSWPPPGIETKPLYLHSNGKLTFAPPASEAAAFDEYISDPNKPVPYIGGQGGGMTREHMTDDQRFASTRTDVLVFESEPLSEDLSVAGPLKSRLFVSTTGTDSDWVVKLIDVYPEDYPTPSPNPTGIHMGGYQQLVRGELFRGKFRNSFEKPEPFTPGKVEKVEYALPDIAHTFRRGHKIMVQVQSSWFPLADRNPQKFMDIYNAKTSDFQKATQRVYHTPDQASCVLVPVRTK